MPWNISNPSLLPYLPRLLIIGHFDHHLYVKVETIPRALSEDELIEKIQGVHVLCIRSKTKVSARVIERANALLAIGCFCIGTDQVDIEAARNVAIPVFNSPFSNCRSVAEMVIGELIMLARQLGDRNTEMHQNLWNKKSKGCYELRGKRLGIIGYGKIGSQVSILAEALGMKVAYYDTANVMSHGNAEPMSDLHSVLKVSDFVTIHVPNTKSTSNLIGLKEVKMIKSGAFFVNASRGNVVDLEALYDALSEGHLAGAALDVFPFEPESNGPIPDDAPFQFFKLFSQLPNVILTPHIGGSTEEAQRAIGEEVASALCKYVSFGVTLGAVAFPEVNMLPHLVPQGSQSCRHLTSKCRLMNFHKNVPGVLKSINKILSCFNIAKQCCDSYGSIAYLVADLDDLDGDELACRKLLEEISRLPDSIFTRMSNPGDRLLFEQ